MNHLLHKEENPALPDAESMEDLCEVFANYYSDKILTIRHNLSTITNQQSNIFCDEEDTFNKDRLTKF